MNIVIEPGLYVVAVSGGVDSIALLDILHKMIPAEGLKLIVAHYDHGIRSDSKGDRLFVQSISDKYGLPFIYDEGRLGINASEAVARDARYIFLDKVQKTSGARAIITAHHQDDMLETAIINIMRGTGRRGLTSLSSSGSIVRPLLHFNKNDIKEYVKLHNLDWREDSSNSDTKYLRNYVRHNLLTKFDDSDKLEMLSHINKLSVINSELNGDLAKYLEIHSAPNQLDRHWFIMLPHAVAREVMHSWLRGQDVVSIDRRQIERLVHGSKTLSLGRKLSVDKTHQITIKKNYLALDSHER
jgi:tRNA(Ile)-lysidine synthase